MIDTASSSPTGAERTTVVGGVDLYRDAHKGLRLALFDLTLAAGRVDVADDAEVGVLVGACRRAIELLRAHDVHEDQLLLHALVETHAPGLAGPLHDERGALAQHLDALACRANELAAAPAAARGATAHAFYLEAAAITGAYLDHLDVEERLVMPALAAACDDGHLRRTQGALLAGIRPEHEALSLAAMLPALNPSERADLVARIRATESPIAGGKPS